MSWLRSIGSMLVVGVLFALFITVVDSVAAIRRTIADWLGGGTATVTSTGPTVTQLDKIGLLTLTRVRVTDILGAEGAGARGAWIVSGACEDLTYPRECVTGTTNPQFHSLKRAISLDVPFVVSLSTLEGALCRLARIGTRVALRAGDRTS